MLHTNIVAPPNRTRVKRAPGASWEHISELGALSRIEKPAVNALVLRRTLPEGLARFVESWLTIAPSKTMVDTLGRFAMPEELAGNSGGFDFRYDVRRLVRAFRELTKAARVVASLEVVSTDRCRKFHVDFKGLRLVCTYAGPGTEWVDNRAARRSQLCRDEACFDTANARIVPFASAIVRGHAGDIVLLKGENFPGNSGRGVVHRSPPVERLGLRRLVLTLDEG